MPTILITGATGLLGTNLVARCLPEWQVVGVSHTRRLVAGIDNLVPVALDLADEPAVAALVADTRPDLIVNCAAATNVDACEADPAMAARLNVETARSVARAAATAGTRLVHVSTDAVYGGAGSWHRETEPICATSVYARTKAAAEEVVLAEAPGSVVARVNFFGLGAAPGGLASWVLGELRAGRALKGFADVWFSPLLANDLAEALLVLGAGDAQGIYNLGGSDRLSKYDFARAIAARVGLRCRSRLARIGRRRGVQGAPAARHLHGRRESTSSRSLHAWRLRRAWRECTSWNPKATPRSSRR